MPTDKPPLLPQLPSLSDALRDAQEALLTVKEKEALGKVFQSLTDENVPETVRLLRAARAKRQMKLMEKERRFQERKLKAKQHYMVKRKNSRDWRYGSLKAFHNRWKQHRSRDEGRMEFPYEDFCYIWGRVAPYKTGDSLWVWSKRVKARMWRKDASLPWTLDNVEPYLITRKGRKYDWRKLPRLPIVDID
jgi:hypothetical protein